MPRALFFVVCSLTYKEVCLLSNLTAWVFVDKADSCLCLEAHKQLFCGLWRDCISRPQRLYPDAFSCKSQSVIQLVTYMALQTYLLCWTAMSTCKQQTS